MSLLKKCSNCGTTLLSGREDGENIFCSEQCQSWFRFPGFCQTCGGETTEEQLGGCYTFNTIGTKLYHLACKGPTCPTCGSVTQRKWFVILFIPIFPASAEYRVRYVSPNRYVSRKVSKAPVGQAVSKSTDACPRCGIALAGRKECPYCAGALDAQQKVAGR